MTENTKSTDLLASSMRETCKHIRRVQTLLADVVMKLISRGVDHDSSKLEEPEAGIFAVMTPKLKTTTYGSDGWFVRRAGEGIKAMSMLDLIEMLVDWKAATERHDNGSLDKSLTINKERFGYGDDMDMLLRNTAFELWPEHN